MPRIVIVIDELRDLLMELDKSDSEELVNGLTRIAQRARNAGMHLVIMTQRPDSAAVPGPLKSQMPARLLLRMGYTDAQTLMTSPPVEVDRLQGKGDSILIDNHHPAGIRVQCAFVDDQNPADRSELEQRLDDIRNTHGQPRYLFELETLDPIEPEPEAPALASDDPRYPDAVLLVVETQSPSKATVKRAGVTNDTEQTRMLQAMDKDGFTGKPSGNKRVVLMTPAEARAKLGF
jgi:DNA segregation ATPase FtsK/SpoIIIE-like protein